jgi:PKD repeat protein
LIANPGLLIPVARPKVRFALLAILAVAMFSLTARPASAVIVHVAGGKALSYQPLRGKAKPARPFDAVFSNLDYNGGPVMPSNTNYVVYWDPSGAPAYPPEYQVGIDTYFEDLAHDSGGTANVDSVSSQYNDASGEFANYNSHFGEALIDTDPYPANGCSHATICLTDAQIQEELVSFVESKHLPTDLTHEYFLLTPPEVESCFEAEGEECSAGSETPFYCAYHGNVPVSGGGELIYSNDPYVTEIVGCDDNNHPNKSTSDGALEGGLTHEHNESITDPEPNNAWTDFGSETGGEIGDKCGEEIGAPIGKTAGGATYNQVINGDFYWYQEEWSNQGHQCLQRLSFTGERPKASFIVLPEGGSTVRFDATGSTAPGGVKHYNWQFNEGSEPGTPVELTTPTITRVFSAETTHVVALTVLAADGTSIGTARTFTVGDEAPTAAFSVTTAEPVGGQPVSFDSSASNDPDGTIASYAWDFGDGSTHIGASPSHTFAASGSYTVKLTITDSAGLSTIKTHQVQVGSESSGGTGGTGGGGTGGSGGSGSGGSTTPSVEQPAPSINPGPLAQQAALSATISLAGSSAPVRRNGQATVRLTCAGSAPLCSGQLTLTAKIAAGSGHRRKRIVTLAAGFFSVRSGQTVGIRLMLNALGRARLLAVGGHLIATLAIRAALPLPVHSQSRTIHLTLQKPSARKTRH